ncbi:hypothetical protein [Microvirga pudoricolor]|uniref:hypothetical protein n=1 Tax=Microvirga pudoricolor TaxID=2778729 RepID=UPI0019510D6E|nr:hypothetical protein [Microvirga pudoricolor]MBM6592456.1 hypothetical protein [Microvirga pudoricolor]
MLRFAARIAIAVACFYVIARLIQHTLVLRLEEHPGLEGHVEQLGSALLAGVALGVGVPITAGRWFVPALLAVGGVLLALHTFVFSAQAEIAHIAMNWIGAAAGLLIMRGLYRSWTAMYERHLVPWGGAHSAPGEPPADEEDEDYHFPQPRRPGR